MRSRNQWIVNIDFHPAYFQTCSACLSRLSMWQTAEIFSRQNSVVLHVKMQERAVCWLLFLINALTKQSRLKVFANEIITYWRAWCQRAYYSQIFAILIWAPSSYNWYSLCNSWYNLNKGWKFNSSLWNDSSKACRFNGHLVSDPVNGSVTAVRITQHYLMALSAICLIMLLVGANRKEAALHATVAINFCKWPRLLVRDGSDYAGPVFRHTPKHLAGGNVQVWQCQGYSVSWNYNEGFPQHKHCRVLSIVRLDGWISKN